MMDQYYTKYIKYKNLYLQEKKNLVSQKLQKGGLLGTTYVIYFNKAQLDRIIKLYSQSKTFRKFACFNYMKQGNIPLSWDEIILLFGFDAWYIEHNSNKLINMAKPLTPQYEMLTKLKADLNKETLDGQVAHSIPTLNIIGLTGQNLDDKITCLHSTYHLSDSPIIVDSKIFNKDSSEVIKTLKLDYPITILNNKLLHPLQLDRGIDSVIVIEVNNLFSSNKLLWYHHFDNFTIGNQDSLQISPLSTPRLSSMSTPLISPLVTPRSSTMFLNPNSQPDTPRSSAMFLNSNSQPSTPRLNPMQSPALKQLSHPTIDLETYCKNLNDNINCDTFEQKKAYLLWHLTK
jgi:hypothetical protein